MNINKILEKVLTDSVSTAHGKIRITEDSFLWNLLGVDDGNGKSFFDEQGLRQLWVANKSKRFFLIRILFSLIGFLWAYLKKKFNDYREKVMTKRFPVTYTLYLILSLVLLCVPTVCYLLLSFLWWLISGKKRDASRYPRVNFMIFISASIIYIVSIVLVIVFFVKSVLLFDPDRRINENGAICVPKGCEREQYIYLLNSATCWANTGIEVSEGDEVTITASGSFFSSASLLYKSVLNNEKPIYDRSFVTFGSEGDSITRSIWMYNQMNARFGSLLVQVAHKSQDLKYDFGKNAIIQLDSINPRFSAKNQGTLFVSVNDIYLSKEVFDSIKNNNSLHKSLDFKDSVAFKQLAEEFPVKWFYDNLGEVLLNITVNHNAVKWTVFEPSPLVKTYRQMEDFFFSPTFWDHEVYWLINVFFGIVIWLFIDNKIIGSILRRCCSPHAVAAAVGVDAQEDEEQEGEAP